jgi:hypothetical protein
MNDVSAATSTPEESLERAEEHACHGEQIHEQHEGAHEQEALHQQGAPTQRGTVPERCHPSRRALLTLGGSARHPAGREQRYRQRKHEAHHDPERPSSGQQRGGQKGQSQQHTTDRREPHGAEGARLGIDRIVEVFHGQAARSAEKVSAPPPREPEAQREHASQAADSFHALEVEDEHGQERERGPGQPGASPKAMATAPRQREGPVQPVERAHAASGSAICSSPHSNSQSSAAQNRAPTAARPRDELATRVTGSASLRARCARHRTQ